MSENENRQQTSPGRLMVLGGFLIAILLVYVAILFDIQYNHGEDYLEESVRTITRTETIQASRGIVTDRNGAVLISNRQTYDLAWDASQLKDGGEEEDPDARRNAAVLRLVQLFRQEGLTWEDHLPITRRAPYSYTVDALSSPYPGWFNAFLRDKLEAVAKDLATEDLSARMLNDAGLTADILMRMMRQAFQIPTDWNDTDARDVLGILYEITVRELVSSAPEYVLVADIDTSLVSLLNDGEYLGAKVVLSSARQYGTTYAAHILGTVGKLQKDDMEDPLFKDYPMDAIVGQDGVERAFEEYLHGVAGTRVVSTNTDGKITGEYYKTAPQPGSTVELTLDLELQKVAEDTLAATITRMNDTKKEDEEPTLGGAAAVVKVGTGEVLALASYPTYDLTTYRNQEVWAQIRIDPASPLLNRATGGLYPPGSTIKPLTAIAALESGVTTLTEKVKDTGWWSYPNDPSHSGFHCWNWAGHGYLNVTQAITASCNYYFGEMGYRMGLNTYREYLTAFGLGDHTGIEIGDKAGLLPENPKGYDYAPQAAFGQANETCTPLQLANYIATLVSGGEHRQAHLLKSVKSYDNTKVVAVGNTDPVNTVDIDPAHLNAVKTGMKGLVTGTLAPYFARCVVDAGAKTGTAQLGDNKTNNGVFVCFAPFDEPEIAVAVVIEHAGAGAALASTAVEIVNGYFTLSGTNGAVTGENELLP